MWYTSLLVKRKKEEGRRKKEEEERERDKKRKYSHFLQKGKNNGKNRSKKKAGERDPYRNGVNKHAPFPPKDIKRERERENESPVVVQGQVRTVEAPLWWTRSSWRRLIRCNTSTRCIRLRRLRPRRRDATVADRAVAEGARRYTAAGVFTVKEVAMPVVAKRQVLTVSSLQKVETALVLFTDKVDNMLVVTQRQVPEVPLNTVNRPQNPMLQIADLEMDEEQLGHYFSLNTRLKVCKWLDR